MAAVAAVAPPRHLLLLLLLLLLQPRPEYSFTGVITEVGETICAGVQRDGVPHHPLQNHDSIFELKSYHSPSPPFCGSLGPFPSGPDPNTLAVARSAERPRFDADKVD